MKNLLPFIVLGLVSLNSSLAVNPYNRSIDPAHAEEILAGLALHSQLSQKKWKSMLGPLKGKTYTVKPGDNLWKISKKVFRDPWLWRKLWEVNRTITNPHEIETGMTLAYFRANRGVASVVPRIPLIKLVPDNGQADSLDSDSFVNLSIKNRYRPSLLIRTENDIIYGEVAGSYEMVKFFTELNDIYIRFDSSFKVHVGDRFSVVHEERKLAIDGPDGEEEELGFLVKVVGEIEIVTLGTKLARAKITGVFDRIQRGDKLIAIQKPVEWLAESYPPNEVELEVLKLVGHRELFGEGQVMLLKGGGHIGVKVGQLFKVYKDMDPVTEEVAGVSPDYKGEIQIISASRLASVGIVLKSSEPVRIGDVLLPAQYFANRSERIDRAMEAIEIK